MSDLAIHSRLALNSVSTIGWSLQQDLDLYSELGVVRAGIMLAKLESVGLEKGIELVRAAGVRATQVMASGMTITDPRAWAAERSMLLRGLDAASALDGVSLAIAAGAPGSMNWDEAAAATARALEPVLDAAERRGLLVAVEQTLPIRPEVGWIHSFGDTVVAARQLGLGAVMECQYCWSEHDLAQAVVNAGERLAVVQLSDLVPPAQAIIDRAVPGDGVLPLGRVIGLVIASGYQGWFELEQLGPRIEAEGYESATRRGVAAVSQLLSAAGT